MALPRLVSVASTPARTLPPERQALAAEIEGWWAANNEVLAIEKVIADAEATYYASVQKRDDAEAAIATAKAAAADFATATALGTAGPPPLTIKQARAALTDAADDCEVAKATVDALRGRQAAAKTTRDYRASARDRAITDLVGCSPEVAALLANTERLLAELADATRALFFLEGVRALGVPWVVTQHPDDHSAAATVLSRLGSPPNTWRGLLDDPSHPGDSVWKAAFEALKTDASAPLPA